MSAAQHAMAGWLGLFSRSGVLDADVRAGAAVAAYVVGEERVDELARWFTTQDARVRERERRAAIEVCISMAHADRVVDPEERHLLRELVGKSGLSEDAQDELVTAVHEPPPLRDLDARLTHPVLRELILALAWELAMADGRIDGAETAFFDHLADQLSIPAERAAEIRDAVGSALT